MSVLPSKTALFFMNPITIWIRWFVLKHLLEFKNRKKSLRLDYLAEVKNCTFGDYNTIYRNSKLLNCNLGSYTYISKDCQIQYTNIGMFCSIAPGVKIGLGLHPSSGFVSTHPLFFSARKQTQLQLFPESIFEEYKITNIGNDVWIGTNAIIRDGITIGNGAIIGAGAVVTENIPSYAIVGGVPAKLIRYRFSNEEINFLNSFKWWDKDLRWLKENKDLFKDIKSFRVTL